MAVVSTLDRYRFISRLGTGGMATVTLGEDTVLGRLVALKRLSTTEDDRGLARLKREALLGASVSHPNLVSIYDVVTSDEHDLVIVMEYVAGETLRQMMTRQGKLPAATALRILEGVAAGLDTIHKRGIVHRDVKPSNILLGADGAVKLADLGIASVPERTRITTAGAVVGSLSYMAPEQLEDRPSRPSIDIYSLSAVAFEVLSGQKARRETNPVALAHAISTQPPPDLREAWPQAPPAAAELLVRGMSRDPAARPGSAGELVGRLRAALEPRDVVPVAPIAPVARIEAAAATPGSASFRPVGGARRATTPAIVPARSDRPVPRSGSSGVRDGGPGVRSVSAEATGARRGTRVIAGGLLALVAAAVALAIVLSTNRSTPPSSLDGTASHRRHHAGTGLRAVAKGSAAATSAGQTGPASTASAASASGSGAPSASGTTTAAQSTPAPSGSGPATTSVPAAESAVSAVESFYGLAASHRFAQAWALADPTFRAQLGGYQSFQSGQAGDRSITFSAAQTVSRSSSSATVSVKTTSVRDDGTHHCAGTVDLSAGSSPGRWLLHMIHINCT